MLIKIVLILFILLELGNVLTMYFNPDSKQANSVGVFNAWEESKQYPEIHEFIKYLVNWIAGVKLIFLLLLLVIIFFADIETQRLTLLALTVTVASFYWRLFPQIRKMDQNGQIDPKNYSTVLGVMIAVFMAIFLGTYFLTG